MLYKEKVIDGQLHYWKNGGWKPITEGVMAEEVNQAREQLKRCEEIIAWRDAGLDTFLKIIKADSLFVPVVQIILEQCKKDSPPSPASIAGMLELAFDLHEKEMTRLSIMDALEWELELEESKYYEIAKGFIR